MILACVCGRRFRTRNESDAKSKACPHCGGPLVPENESLVPAMDINVMIEQMKVLRDELVARDRQLRRAQAETTVLRAELEQLRARCASVQAPPPPREEPAPAPVSPPVAAAAPIPHELPSNRVPLFAMRDP
jgi:hypothetical protein